MPFSEGLDDEARGPPASSLPGGRKRLTQFLTGFLIVALLGGFVVFTAKREEESAVAQETMSEVQEKQSSVINGNCVDVCRARLDERRDYDGGDLLSNADLLMLVQKSRDRVVDELKSKYGGTERFSSIFESSPGKLRESFVSPGHDGGVSVQRFQRKLQMKILEVQAGISSENAKPFKGCDCNGEPIGSRRIQETDFIHRERFLSRFVWSTAGHSAAAGHGNLHNESYTAFLEHVAKPVFNAIGIEFEGRNYAMGGTASAPMMAFCNEAIYGTDGKSLPSTVCKKHSTSHFSRYLSRCY